MRTLALVMLAATLAGCAYSYSSGMGYVEHRTSPLMLWSQPSSQLSERAADRKISEQDCTTPIASATANLKCR